MSARPITAQTPPLVAAFAFALALIAALHFFPPRPALADGHGDLAAFQSANQMYDDGEYEEAALSYERLIGLGADDPTLYYNLANAYYKTDDLGRAILNYMRARRLAPFDSDIAANLELALREAETSPSLRAPVPTLAQLAERVPAGVAPPLALGCWLALGGIAAALALGWRPRPSRSAALRRTVIALAALTVVSASVALGEYIGDRHWRSVGIITAESAEVFSGPGERYASRFNLDAGDEAIIVQTRGGWSRITIPGSDLDGWIRQSDAETVIAR